jgi:hypothetical protein
LTRAPRGCDDGASRNYKEVRVKRLIWILVAVAVLAALMAGRSIYMEAALDAELASLEETKNPARTYDRAVAFLRKHPDLDRVRLDQALSTLMNAAFEAGDVDGLVAGLDSLGSEPMSPPVLHRLRAELHDALVMRTMMSPTEGDLERADELARELLKVTDLRAGNYTMMASLRSAMLADAPSRSTHWLTVELAWRGLNLTESPDRAPETFTLSNAVETLLGHIAEAGGVSAALASADSMATALSDPTLRAVVNANRYKLAAEDSPALALEYARVLAEARGDMESWRVANSVAVDIRDRGLDYDLALDLSGWALDLARARSDSQTVLNTIGWTHHLAEDDESARDYLERSVAMLDGAPTLDDSAVTRLLAVYEEEALHEPGIELLATVIARSVEPNEEARGRLAALLAGSGRDRGSMTELIASHRYAGVRDAPDFSVETSEGEVLTLAALSGRVVLLGFMSSG